MSAFLEYHLKPIAQKIKSYIKDTNDFLRKLDALFLWQKILFYVQ